MSIKKTLLSGAVIFRTLAKLCRGIDSWSDRTVGTIVAVLAGEFSASTPCELFSEKIMTHEMFAACRPVEEGYFQIPQNSDEKVRLIASYSPSANQYYYPRRMRCPITEGEVEDNLLSPTGTLYSWTYIYRSDFAGSRMEKTMESSSGNIGVGQVEFPEGPRVQGLLLGEPKDWAIGQRIELTLFEVRKDDDGVPVCTFAFKPI